MGPHQVLVLSFMIGCYTRITRAQLGDYTKNLFINGDLSPPNDRITAGTHCTYDTDSAVIDVVLRINENDETFHYTNEDGSPGDLVTYECRLMETSQGILDTLQSVGDVSGCPSSSSTFTRVSATAPTNNAVGLEQYRTHELVISSESDPGSGYPVSLKCGGRRATAAAPVEYFASCKRSFDFDHWSDVNVLFRIDPTTCTSTIQANGPYEVENPSGTDLNGQYAITFDMYKSPTFRYVSDLNDNFITTEQQKSPIGQKVDGSGVALGASVYLEGCISIDDVKNLYFIEGVSYLGLKFSNCKATPATPGTQYVPGVVQVDLSDANGCGLKNSPAKQWLHYVFSYGMGGALADKPFYEGPNCFRSEIFEAVSFARKDISGLSTVIFSCDIGYCTDTTDNLCFGTTAGGTAYPACTPPGSGRKRRSDFVQVPNLPSTLSVNLTIYNEPTKQDAVLDDDCFDKTTFFSLLAVLLTMIVFFITSNVLMGVKLRIKNQGKRAPSSMSTSSTYSS